MSIRNIEYVYLLFLSNLIFSKLKKDLQQYLIINDIAYFINQLSYFI